MPRLIGRSVSWEHWDSIELEYQIYSINNPNNNSIKKELKMSPVLLLQ